MSPTLASQGYLRVLLRRDDGRRIFRDIHRLVAEAFIGPCPEGHQVRHMDGNRTNSVLSNLTYGTCRDNQLDSIAHGTHANAAKTHCPKNHPYDEANTYRPPSRPTERLCRQCHSDRYQQAKVRP